MAWHVALPHAQFSIFLLNECMRARAVSNDQCEVTGCLLKLVYTWLYLVKASIYMVVFERALQPFQGNFG